MINLSKDEWGFPPSAAQQSKYNKIADTYEAFCKREGIEYIHTMDELLLDLIEGSPLHIELSKLLKAWDAVDV